MDDFGREEEEETLVVGMDEDVGEGGGGGWGGIQGDVSYLTNDTIGDDRFDVGDGEREEEGMENGR